MALLDDNDKSKITKSTVDALNNQETFGQYQSPIPGMSAPLYAIFYILLGICFIGFLYLLGNVFNPFISAIIIAFVFIFIIVSTVIKEFS